MTEWWAMETAADFWESCGGFSADFEAAVLFTLPLTIERLEKLTTLEASNWLHRHSYKDLEQPERPLRGCLVVLGGSANFVFLDNSDSVAEQKFSLAHEVAHYLLDYLHPRQKAVEKMGQRILEVLDGVRPANPAERIEGTLAGVPIRTYHHFMERDNKGDILSTEVLAAESRADQLALELLAPEELALSLIAPSIKGIPTFEARLEITREILWEKFGLPETVISGYTKRLVQKSGGGQTFLEWLK